MLERLQKYLSDPYYNFGVALLRGLGHDKVELKALEGYMKQDFAPREAQKRVDTLILDYYNSLSIKESTPSVQKTTGTIKPLIYKDCPPNDTPVSFKNEPPIITELRNESRQLQDDRRFIHSSLLDTEGDDERLNRCQRIRSMTKRIDKIWTIIDDFEVTGNEPIQAVAIVSKEKTAVEELMELNTKVLSLRPRICRLKNWVNDANIGTTKKERYQSELEVKERELEETLKKLNQLK
jgi:hypothetical protein